MASGERHESYAGASDNGPLSLLRTARRLCGPRWTSLVDVGGVRPRLVAAPVTGVGSWIGRGCGRMCVTVCRRPWWGLGGV